uniref:Uncharacterized protein n=1 Tax=Arundo donax TaxID=35708 RepID=A0A0A9FQ80_ARUDO
MNWDNLGDIDWELEKIDWD